MAKTITSKEPSTAYPVPSAQHRKPPPAARLKDVPFYKWQHSDARPARDSVLAARHSQLGTRNRVLGFTLIELMIVITIIMILASISIPIYMNSIVHAKEAVLRDDLFTLRNCIDQYTLDKQNAPQSLQDLVSGGYLKALPKDPFTNSTDSWQVVSDDTLMDPNQGQPGITDVHSGASGVGTDGSAYSSW